MAQVSAAEPPLPLPEPNTGVELKMSELMKRAAAAGVGLESLADAQDAADPRAAVLALLQFAAAATATAAAAPAPVAAGSRTLAARTRSAEERCLWGSNLRYRLRLDNL